ncbi:MAG: hypothetical protein V4513_06765 [Pseudomonadota bacterium]
MRKLMYLPLLALAGCATAPIATGAPVLKDPSVVTWTRLYCTADNESHFETKSFALDKVNFAPPASPIFIGGGGSARKIVFGGFEENWGAADVQSGKTHPTPVTQWITLLSGSMVISTTDGQSRLLRPGDIMRLEDAAPCRGHITRNLAPGATFLQFVQD